MHRSGERADAVVRLDLVNLVDSRVRVDEASVTFLSGDRVLDTRALQKAFFQDPAAPRATRIDKGRRAKWGKICLDSIPAEADRLRFDLGLSVSRGLRRTRSRQSVTSVLDPEPERMRLRLPFDGNWGVSQGHACSSNHRVNGFGGDFAWDFVAVGPGGRVVKDAYDESHPRNDDTFAFGKPVLAPVSGHVVKIVDDLPDNDGIKQYPRRSILDINARPDWNFGNHVVIDAGRGTFVLLGHLRRGSITLRPGQEVNAGEPIGQCGNSGNAIAPHVHVQVMDRPDPAHPEVRGLPAWFEDYVQRGARVALGDPPEGVIVGPAE